MRPSFMGLEAAKSGLMVTQKALDIVGNNMTNVKTKGYTRQRLDTVSMRLYGGATYGSAVSLAGQGVKAVGVGQTRNAYLDYKFREKYSDVGYYDQKMAVMEQLESIISDPEVDDVGIQNALKSLTDAISELASSPASKDTNSKLVLNAFKEVVSLVNKYDSEMKNLVEQTKGDMATAVNDFNSLLKQVAQMNEEIAKEVFNNSDFDGVRYGPNELMDDRNLLLDELSRYGKVSVEAKSDGTVDVLLNGYKVVGTDGPNYWADELCVDQEGTGVFWASTGQMAGLGNGLINGFQDALKGTSLSSPGIPHYQEQLDSFAQGLYDAFNNILHVESDDPDAPVAFKQLLKGGIDGTVTAGNLAISDEWIANASYILSNDGNTDDIDAMKALMDKDITIGGFTGKFDEFIANLATSLGSDMNNNDTRLKAALAVAETAETNRQSESGVSLNEEGVNMMSLNKSFQALGRLMTAMDEQLDVIINQMGLVGR